MATVGARLQGAGLVIAIESIENRKELARHYGADVVVDFRERDLVEAIMALTKGEVQAAVHGRGIDFQVHDNQVDLFRLQLLDEKNLILVRGLIKLKNLFFIDLQEGGRDSHFRDAY